MQRAGRLVKARSRARHKGRREHGTFAAIPHAVMDSPAWRLCSGTAIKLLCDLARQYRGNNNGDLCAAAAIVPGYAPETRTRALRELRHYGLLLLTRQGGLHGPSLFALSWNAIDDCGRRLEVAPTVTPPGDWKGAKVAYKPTPRKRKPTTDSEIDRYGFRSDDPVKTP